MMGVPEEDRALVLAQSNIVLSGGDPELIENQDDPLTAFLEAGMALAGVMERLAAERLERPTDDLTTALVRSEVDGERLTHAEIASFFILLLVAGNETTRNAITQGVLALSEHPEQRAPLDGRPDADPHRGRGDRPLGQPGHLDAAHRDPGRRARRPPVPGRRQVPALLRRGQPRPGRLRRPARVRPRRAIPNPHVGFGGHGPHFCLGAHLARREIAVTFRALFDRLPDLEVTGEPDRLRSSFVNGIKRLPARLTGAR